MNIKYIKSGIKTKVFGKNIFYFEEIESTNKLAMDELQNKIIEEGSIYICQRQTNGQGSYGNKWQSKNNFGLWMSIIVHSPYQHDPATFVPAIALSDLLKEYNIESNLKWPNDILIGNKKIAGILCQAKQMPNNNYGCVMGIGININHSIQDFSIDIQNKATSMKIITNREYDIIEIFQKYIEHFENIYYGNSDIIELWKERSNMIGKIITGKKNNETFKVKVIDITKEGYLKIENENKIETWMSRNYLDISTDF